MSILISFVAIFCCVLLSTINKVILAIRAMVGI